MRKNIIAFVFFILFSLISFFIFPHKALAVCEVSVNPNSVAINYDGNITLSSVNDACFGADVAYKIVAYPMNRALKNDVYKLKGGKLYQPVIGESSTSDITKLNVSLSFKQDESYIKPRDIGRWTILVCDSSIQTDECDKYIVAKGQLNVTSIAPTPTPTPQSDQPIIDPTKQDSCVFQESYDPNSFITIRVDNIDPSKTYVWWWDDDYKKNITANLTPIAQDTPPLTTTPSPSPSLTPPLYELKIRKSDLHNLKNIKHEKGHLLCIDLFGQNRTPANCLRLYFTYQAPEGNTVCTEANSGEVTPTPKPHLPPCSNWVYLDGSPLPTPTEPNGTQEEYIRQNNLRNQIKCESVPTGLGNIKTDPFDFVKYILSLLLSLAGGIAVILIIISGYRLMTSQGNPEAVQGARDQLTSAIVGFLFIIFSLVLLEVIGVNILHIPGFEP